MKPPILASLALAAAAGACGLGSSAPSVTMPSREGHSTAYFPVAAGSGHADVSCEACHGTFDTFRKYDCVTCHLDREPGLKASHLAAGESGFPDVSGPDRSVPSAECRFCHADGSATGVDHTNLFPRGPGSKHAAATCRECHPDAANRKALGCAGCHDHEQAAMATAHAGVTAGPDGYEFTSAKCVRCHAASDVKTVASHLPFGITGATPHAGPTRDLCLRCHANLRSDRPYAAALFSDATCTKTCHSGAHRKGETCWAAGCHPDGRSNGN